MNKHSIPLYSLLILLVALVALTLLQAFPVAFENALNMVNSFIGGA